MTLQNTRDNRVFDARSRVLLNATGAGLGILTAEGRIVECNEAFAQLYAKRGSADAQGRLITDFVPAPAGEERRDLVRRSLELGRPVVFNELWNGLELHGVILPMDPIGDAPAARPTIAALIIRHGTALPGATDPQNAEVVQTHHSDLGPLAELSRRELEVLAFIGAGLTNHEIAKRIYRSDKTVEWHRSQLGAKLNVSTRVELAKIAHRAGLREWLDQHGGEPLGPRDDDHDLTPSCAEPQILA
ncbi:MAG: LuxR C-terminal-related transcriptional regulator [Phycisphaerales bacterium]|nr:LuxR C-terminal-related transcriptional regulator [Phycisphaerales bacterium]